MNAFGLVHVICGVMLLSQVQAAQIFISESDSFPNGAAAVAASNYNPIFQINAAIPTRHVYLWVKLAPDDAQGNATERINSMGVDVVQEGQAPAPVAMAHGTTFFTYGQSDAPSSTLRWDVPGPPTPPPTPATSFNEFVGSPTLARFRRAAVAGIGLQSPLAAGDHDTQSIRDASGNWYMRFADITITVDQLPTDTIPVFLRTNPLIISYDTRFPNHGPNVFLGAGDASVNPTNGAGGVQSALPDAYLSIAPEPAVSLMMALVAVALLQPRKPNEP